MNEPYAVCVRVDDEFAGSVPTCRMRAAVLHLLDVYEVVQGTGLTLLVTNDEAIRKLNARYRGVDSPTDVLSFPADDDDLPPDLEEEPYLGDILISYPYTARHAQQDQHPIEDVLVLLAIHGTLHLLGFDHDNAENQAAMWEAQEDALKALGISTQVIPAPHDYSAEDGES